MYRVKTKKPSTFDYDLIVIGSGSGGSIAAHMSARLKKKVAIIEAGELGGECPNFGCVPTKALLASAEAYRDAKSASKFGIRTTGVTFNYGSIKAWKDHAVHKTGTHEGAQSFKKEGIDIIRSRAHFLDKWTVSTGSRRYTARKFLISTGTYDVIPPIEGLMTAGFITYKQAIDLTKPPKSLFIIGGGAIGCEFAQIFNTFGTRVHIAEFSPRLNPKEDQEMGLLIGEIFASEGISVHTNTRVIKVTGRPGRKEVTYLHNGDEHKAIVEEVLLSAGKAARTDLGLENAGVKYDRRGIITDAHMKTSCPHIYATGDVTGPYMFTHMASYQSRIAAHNMWHKKKIRAEYHAVPRCVYVSPEAASVGLTEEELRAKGVQYQKSAVPISLVGRSNVSQQDTGFVKVLAAHNGVLLGATIVAPRAGEMIHELTLAVQKGLKAADIEQTIHAFPTWNEAVRIACARLVSF